MAKKKERRAPFDSLVSAKVLSDGMTNKGAASRFLRCHLHLAHRRDPEHGIESLFKEKPRTGRGVTALNKNIATVTSHFSSWNSDVNYNTMFWRTSLLTISKIRISYFYGPKPRPIEKENILILCNTMVD